MPISVCYLLVRIRRDDNEILVVTNSVRFRQSGDRAGTSLFLKRLALISLFDSTVDPFLPNRRNGFETPMGRVEYLQSLRICCLPPKNVNSLQGKSLS